MKQVNLEDVVTDREIRLEKALRKIMAIEDKLDGGDWDEIEEARQIAKEALEE